MATSNKDMNDMMRGRRAEMAAMPADEPEPPAEEEAGKKFTVAAPGEPGDDTKFEYEPVVDRPGAWVVYPPGVPCDDTEYRISMDSPAAESDFAGMQEALEDAGATNPEPAPDSEVAEGEY